MSDRVLVVLTWAECIASVIARAIPAIRSIVSDFDTTKAEVARIRKDRE